MIYRFKNVDLQEEDWSDLHRTARILLARKHDVYGAQLLLDLLEKADRIPGPDENTSR